MLSSSTGVQIPALSGATGFTPVRLPAALSQFNPAAFAADLVTPYVQGIKAGSELMAPIHDAIDYISPENRALRAARIAIAKSQAETAPREAKFKISQMDAEEPLFAKKAGLEGMQIDTKGSMLPLEAEAQRGALNKQIAVNPAQTEAEIATAKANALMAGQDLEFMSGAAPEIQKAKASKLKNQLDSLDVDSQAIQQKLMDLGNQKDLAPDLYKKQRDDLETEMKSNEAKKAELNQTIKDFESMDKPALSGVNITNTEKGQSADFGPLNPYSTVMQANRLVRLKRAPDFDTAMDMVMAQSSGTPFMTKDQKKAFSDITEKFRKDKVVEDLNQVLGSYSKLGGALTQKNGYGDLSVIDTLNQIVNKAGVTVKEANVDLIKDAQSMLTKYNPAYWVKHAGTGAILDDTDRTKIATLSKILLGKLTSNVMTNILPSYQQEAKNSHLNPDVVGAEIKKADMELNGQTSEKQGAKKPEVGDTITSSGGKKYIFRGMDPKKPGHILVDPVL